MSMSSYSPFILKDSDIVERNLKDLIKNREAMLITGKIGLEKPKKKEKVK